MFFLKSFPDCDFRVNINAIPKEYTKMNAKEKLFKVKVLFPGRKAYIENHKFSSDFAEYLCSYLQTSCRLVYKYVRVISCSICWLPQSGFVEFNMKINNPKCQTESKPLKLRLLQK